MEIEREVVTVHNTIPTEDVLAHGGSVMHANMLRLTMLTG